MAALGLPMARARGHAPEKFAPSTPDPLTVEAGIKEMIPTDGDQKKNVMAYLLADLGRPVARGEDGA